MTINILVLCQRSSGSLSFKKEYVKSVEKDIETLINIQRNADDIMIIDFLTKGFGHEDDKMTFKIDFNYRNKETIDFVKSHKNYYSYIVIGQCPFFIFNNPNVLLLSHIMKDNGLMILNTSDNPKFKQEWWIETKDTFATYFEIISINPKVIMMKISHEKGERKYGFGKPKKSPRKSPRKSLRKIKKSPKRKSRNKFSKKKKN